MPKFYKPAVQDNTPSNNNPSPAEIIAENSVEIPKTGNIGVEMEFHIPEYHPLTTTEHHQIDAPTGLDFPLPKDDEPLLPSPLDTPELPEHATPPNPDPEEQKDSGPLFKPQPIGTTVPFMSTSIPSSIPGLSGFPVPESKMVETLMSWRASSRPHRKKNRSFYTTVAILIILIAMISLLAGERMLVAVLFALMFLVYVLNFIEPGEIDYKISTQGVTIDEHFYHWQELDSFWFEKKDGFTVLHIFTQLKFPTMLMLVLGPTTHEDEVRKTVARFLPYHEIPPKSMIEKWAESLQKYFPLENPHK